MHACVYVCVHMCVCMCACTGERERVTQWLKDEEEKQENEERDNEVTFDRREVERGHEDICTRAEEDLRVRAERIWQ